MSSLLMPLRQDSNHTMSFFQNTSIPSGSAIESLIPPSLRPYLSLSYPVSRTRAALTLSSQNHLRHSTQTLYDKGPNDIYFVAFCAVTFTLLREFVLRAVMKPFASYWLASTSRKARKKSPTKSGTKETKRELRQREHTALRFAEQGWSFVYCTFFWSLGMVSLDRVTCTDFA
jgi:acyl-CoA-dependent ceramide synthase